MLISEFLNNSALREIEERAIADKDNFRIHLEQAATLLFGNNYSPVIFSNAKRFNESGSPIGNTELNKKGLHIFRYAFSTYAARHRSTVPEFLNQGYVRVDNFLPEEYHLKVQQECVRYPVSINKQPFNNCQKESEKNPGINYLVNKSNMKDIIVRCLGVDTQETTNLYNTNTFIQRVDNKPNDKDEQKDIHSDIFFPAVKWWYFPDEVKLGQGPFRFQTSAPAYDEKFWNWLYNESILISNGSWNKNKKRGHPEGSIRANDLDLQQMGLTLSPITVPANTLVIANVQLFHGRGDTTIPHIRNAIHGSIRISNPFTV